MSTAAATAVLVILGGLVLLLLAVAVHDWWSRRAIRACPQYPYCDCDPRVPRPGQRMVAVHGVAAPLPYEPPSGALWPTDYDG